MSSPERTWLDRAIGWFAPMRGLQRAQARAVLGTLLAYDGARKGRRTDGWATRGSSADAEVLDASQLIRDRARDLVRNNPHATKGLAVIVSNTIGTGILAQSEDVNRRRSKRLDDRWKRWVDECDADGNHDLYGIQTLVARTRAESGEVLVRFIGRELGQGPEVPIQLQVLEPDHLDSSRHGQNTENGNQIRYGIETNPSGQRVAYWIFSTHPGDSLALIRGSGRGYTSERVPASEVLHIFRRLRPGQTRGITDFAPVILRLRDLDDWHDAKLMRAKIDACLSAFVSSPSSLPGASIGPVATDASGRIETLYPGMVGYLKPGESITVSDPKALDDRGFNSDELHAIAAGLLVPFELLSGDLSEVNYSSYRAGLVDFRRMVEADQWQVMVPQFCRPVWQRFTRMASLVDPLIDPAAPVSWTPPRFELIDPAKEVPAIVDSIKAGLVSYPTAIRREGYDPNELLDEAEAWQKDLDRRGLVLTSDPRTEQPKVASPPEPPPPEPEPKARLVLRKIERDAKGRIASVIEEVA